MVGKVLVKVCVHTDAAKNTAAISAAEGRPITDGVGEYNAEGEMAMSVSANEDSPNPEAEGRHDLLG